MVTVTTIGENVATYKEISAHFAAYEKAKNEHIHALKVASRELHHCFVASLSLAEKSWADPSGRSQPFSKIGVIEGDGIEANAFEYQFGEKGGVTIQFAISLVLEREPGLFPKTMTYVQLSMTRAGEALRVTIEPGGPVIEVPAEGDDSRFYPVCAAISQKIIGEFPLSDFPVD